MSISTSSGAYRRAALMKSSITLCAIAASLVAEQASAQLFDPYATGQTSQPATGTYQSDRGILFGQPLPAGAGTQPGQQQLGGAGQNAANSGQFDASSASAGADSGFNPVTISGGQSQGTGDMSPVLTPTDGRNPGALYARQLPTPGQFELFQKPPPPLNEFELYVQDQVGEPLQRFGSNLLLQKTQGFMVPPTTAVPPDYILNPGDRLDIGLTGGAEANLRLVIDNEGKIFIPKVGAVSVAGVRYRDLQATLERRIGAQYRRVTVSATAGRLHGITVYVTGFATTPGAYTMNSLSTMINGVLSAGGPSSGGSYRTIELRRGGRLISTLDLYELLFSGDKSHDAILQNGDVLNILPTGPELAVVGSVNQPGIFEAKPGESLADILRYAGGFSGVADTSRVVVRSLSDLDKGGSRQVVAAELAPTVAQRGDIVRVLSLARVARPREHEFVLATIEGEVAHPGRYYLEPGATLGDLVSKAGGLTTGAFTYGTLVERASIRKEEEASFDRALQNLELAAAAQPLQASIANGGATAATARSESALKIIDRLKQQRPDGRVVLNIEPGGPLPLETSLENNDRIFIPPTPSTVGVFGAAYKTGSFLFTPDRRIGDYVKLAGGPQRIGARNDLFVVRSNGSVVSMREASNLLRQKALPGDVIFVPVRSNATAFDKAVAILNALSGPLVGAGVLVSLTR